MKLNWQKIQDWQNENREQLIMVADPREDSISISFGGLNTFVRFPPSKDMKDGVVFNALRKSKFEQSIDAFMSGLMSATGISDKTEGGEILKVLGGSMKKIGEQREEEYRSKLSKQFSKENVKNKNKSK